MAVYLGIFAMDLDDIVSPYYFTTIGKFLPFWIGFQINSVTLEWYSNTENKQKIQKHHWTKIN